MKELANKIQELRKKMNMSQDDLAQKIGVSRQAISKWEREEGLPDLYNIKRLAETFNITVDELISEQTGQRISPQSQPNKLAFALMSAPMFVFALATFITTLMCIILTVITIQDIISMSRYQLEANWSSLIILPALGFGVLFLITYINIVRNHKPQKNKLMHTILYGLAILSYLLLLIVLDVEGFTLIFLYIIGLLVFIMGLVGTLMYDASIIKVYPEKPIRVARKGIKISGILYVIIISVFLLQLFQTYVLTKEIRYVSDISITTWDHDFHLDLVHNDTNTDNDYFSADVSYQLTLNEGITDPYIKIFVQDRLMFEGALTYHENSEYNYIFNFESDDIQLPLILLEENTMYYDFWNLDSTTKCVVTYSESGTQKTKTITLDEYDSWDSRTQSVWIWEYKNIIENGIQT